MYSFLDSHVPVGLSQVYDTAQVRQKYVLQGESRLTHACATKWHGWSHSGTPLRCRHAVKFKYD